MKPHELLRIMKAVYGLLNAPREWNRSLCEFLVSDGWRQNKLDQCLFEWIEHDEVTGHLGLHVDDVLCTGRGESFDSALERLKTRFRFGTWENAQEKPIMYCGCEIAQGADFSIRVRQTEYCSSVHEIPLSQERRSNPQDAISQEERTQMRQRLGALNWRATQTAPWLLATVSVLQGCVEQGVVADLLAVNKLVRLHRKHAEEGLFFPSFEGECTIVTFCDASWATRKDSSSQGGQVTLLMRRDVLQGARVPFHVLSWTSKRLKRVCRSSTAAETQMAANALDTHEFVKLAWYHSCNVELKLGDTDKYLCRIPSCMVCDAKNVYDGVVTVQTSGLKMEEKRTALELLAIRERLGQAAVSLRWVNSDQELADGMTKPWRHEDLIKALRLAEWRIVYDPAYQSARRVRALKKGRSSDEFEALVCLLELMQSQAKDVHGPTPNSHRSKIFCCL